MLLDSLVISSSKTISMVICIITSNLSILVGEFTCMISNSRGAAEKTLLLEGGYMLHLWHAIINFDPIPPIQVFISSAVL